ncbi:MAG TPA: ABC transporter permease [Solirubrobacteraceae bacterium]|nr:ABC transporter permease [Solirubrobacteraceae bacterium]
MGALVAALAEAGRGLRVRRRRVIATGLGIALAAAMLSAAVVVADGLGLGFARSARAAGLPDLIVRFNPQPRATVRQRIRALPDIAGVATRMELDNVPIGYGTRARDDAVAEIVDPRGRRGYAVVAGRNLSPGGRQVLLEQAFAQAWHVSLGSSFRVGGLGPLRVVGFVQAPDNVGFPLAAPRFYVSRGGVAGRFAGVARPRVNYAEIWLRNPAYLNEVLVQARDTSFGLRNLRFATRAGLKVLRDQAAGIVIDLLVALSLISLVTAGVMLAASARAEVQRRLGAIGVQRSVGATGGHVTLAHALEAALVAVPAAALGCAGGALAVYGPAQRLLTLLNEPAPGRALVLPLVACWVAAVGLPVAGVAWPAWRAARRPVVDLLRGGDVARAASERAPWRRRLAALAPGGPGALGVRLVGARRVRLAATILTLGLSAAFVLLMLSLASGLSALETDPAALGRHYQLTANLPPAAAARVRRIPGVAAVAPRYEVEAVDSFSLGETVDVVAYPGDHTVFEAPPLLSGRRLGGGGGAEVGEGLAQALGLAPGGPMALQLPNGRELRLTVSGVVSSVDQDGRVAYIPASALRRADPQAPSQLAIVLSSGANPARVSAALAALGAQPAAATGATGRGGPLVAVLRTILRAIAVVDGLVCLYALIQACALTVQERRRTVAVLRAVGGGSGAVRRLLLGAALALVVPAAAVGVVLERFVFGPALSRLAVNYASLPLAATGREVLATVAGLLVAAGLAALWVARSAGRESVVAGLSA